MVKFMKKNSDQLKKKKDQIDTYLVTISLLGLYPRKMEAVCGSHFDS